MQYKNIQSSNKHEKTRSLRRLFKVELFDSDDKDRFKTHVETVIAWNATDAIRRSGGRAVEQPLSLGYVSWPTEEDDNIYIIKTPKVGPVGDPIKPSMGYVDLSDWDF